MKISEIRFYQGQELFRNERTGELSYMLPRMRTDYIKRRLRKLDDRFYFFVGAKIGDMVEADDAIGEELPSWLITGIVDTQIDEVVSFVAYEKNDYPFPRSIVINQSETNPKYQQQGFARYLYTALAGMGGFLVSDESQTDNGARMWTSIAKVPELKVYGYIVFGSGRDPVNDKELSEKNIIDDIKQIGGKQIRAPRYATFLFPVKNLGDRMDTSVKTKNDLRVYNGIATNIYDIGLIATKKTSLLEESETAQTFRGTIRTQGGAQQAVFVQAVTQDIARQMLKAMYGNSLQSSVVKVK